MDDPLKVPFNQGFHLTGFVSDGVALQFQ